MFGFLIGTVSLIALIKVLRGGWRHGYAGGCGGGGYGHHGWGRGWGRHGGGRGWGGWGGGGWAGGLGGRGARGMLRFLFERLETSPGQERVIVEAVDEVREAASKMRGEARASASDIADVLRSADVDATALGNLFARHDTAMDGIRKAVVGALSKVHDALDENQRKVLADMVAGWSGAGPGSWGGGGPYRSAEPTNQA
jgi:hypothetical protein